MTYALSLKTLERTECTGEVEPLEFKKGLNLIMGKPNTGKTRWIEMFDYLLGFRGRPEEAFGEDLACKYDSVRALIEIGNQEVTLERRWKVDGLKTKVLVNGEEVSVDEFSSYFLEKLDIPQLHFPTGDPYSGKTWPELSFRTLFRHMYRQEKKWAEIADKQPPGDQHASIAQFLGLAENIFPSDYGKMVDKRRQIIKLEAIKDQQKIILDQITSDLMRELGSNIFATPQFISLKIKNLQTRMDSLSSEREKILAEPSRTSQDEGNLNERCALLEQLNNVNSQITGLIDRRRILTELIIRTAHEEDKLIRAKKAGSLLRNLRVTHCPACNQKVDLKDDEKVCDLCHQQIFTPLNKDAGTERVDFELAQLKSERLEADVFNKKLETELMSCQQKKESIEYNIRRIDDELSNLRSKVSALYGSKIASIDLERGKIIERIDFFNGIQKSLSRIENIAKDIDRLSAEIGELEAIVDSSISAAKMEERSEALGNGMSTYLSEINKQGKTLWNFDRINFNITERSFSFHIGGQRWNDKLGAAFTCYFLLSYHYSLLSLTGEEGYHYPGLLIIDLPTDILDAPSSENMSRLIDPFQNLCSLNKNIQTIIIGRSFKEVEGANIIEMKKEWNTNTNQ